MYTPTRGQDQGFATGAAVQRHLEDNSLSSETRRDFGRQNRSGYGSSGRRSDRDSGRGGRSSRNGSRRSSRSGDGTRRSRRDNLDDHHPDFADSLFNVYHPRGNDGQSHNNSRRNSHSLDNNLSQHHHHGTGLKIGRHTGGFHHSSGASHSHHGTRSGALPSPCFHVQTAVTTDADADSKTKTEAKPEAEPEATSNTVNIVAS